MPVTDARLLIVEASVVRGCLNYQIHLAQAVALSDLEIQKLERKRVMMLLTR